MKYHRYSEAELDFIKSKIAMKWNFPQITEAFNEEFGTDIDSYRLQQAMFYRGIHSGRRGSYAFPVGTIRWRAISKNNGEKAKEQYIKIAEPNEWKVYRYYLYEQIYGEVPNDCVLVAIDHNRNNVSPENQYCITKKDLGIIMIQELKWYDRDSLDALVSLARLQSKLKEDYGENWRAYLQRGTIIKKGVKVK